MSKLTREEIAVLQEAELGLTGGDSVLLTCAKYAGFISEEEWNAAFCTQSHVTNEEYFMFACFIILALTDDLGC